MQQVNRLRATWKPQGRGVHCDYVQIAAERRPLILASSLFQSARAVLGNVFQQYRPPRCCNTLDLSGGSDLIREPNCSISTDEIGEQVISQLFVLEKLHSELLVPFPGQGSNSDPSPQH